MSLFLKSFHQGNIFEILADFLLGSLGVSNPPRRQFDYGYDFYCYLSETITENDRLLRFDYPYVIQIKSSQDQFITYGNKKSQKWKKEDVDWLFKHETPFFIGFLDKENYELKIYDTTGIWFLYVNEIRNCSQVTFCPSQDLIVDFPSEDLPDNFDFMSLPMRKIPNSVALMDWEAGKGDGFEHTIDLGNPIITLSVEDTKDPMKLLAIKGVLKNVIEAEKQNIANRNLGINFFTEIKNNFPNNSQFFIGSIFNTHTITYVDKLKPHLRDALISLLVNTNHNNTELYSAVKNVLRLLPKGYYYAQLYRQNPQLFDWIKDE